MREKRGEGWMGEEGKVASGVGWKLRWMEIDAREGEREITIDAMMMLLKREEKKEQIERRVFKKNEIRRH